MKCPNCFWYLRYAKEMRLLGGQEFKIWIGNCPNPDCPVDKIA